jgi:primary-amine oxidase
MGLASSSYKALIRPKEPIYHPRTNMIVDHLAFLFLAVTASARPSPKVPSFVKAPHRHHYRNNDSPSLSTPQKTTAPYKNIFNSLTNDEAASIISFLHSQESLNLTAADSAGSWDNSIMVVDLAAPNKTDALSYFAGGDEPSRWATASISFGATEEPYVQQWVVGPLPLDDGAMFYPDTFGTHTDDAKIRIYDMDDSSAFVYDKAMEMDDILHDLLESESGPATRQGIY